MSRDKDYQEMTVKRNHDLSCLVVIDKLVVGPVKVEKKRMIAPYQIWQNGQNYTTNLIYRFEENVFNPTEIESINLASMIAAQVAINYGLFCKEIIFSGSYDAHDRRFIEKMMHNTAREIYVKKFLEENPFLVGNAAKLPAIKAENYTQSAIHYSDSDDQISEESGKWASNPKQFVLLSSGGKDSLLSFGVLDELGNTIHPIFVNESGRHWYTALNAFRYFRQRIPLTTRVWTNADRVFNWMLRHFPFIRSDYATIRADEYPIRLWTVAVFLFSALPLMRKRKIGYLVIGDEHDTTHREHHQGIPHYDGLYDQSRYFDKAISHYFHKKGWGITQFSVLRPLSELLIEKILVSRYPVLQKNQMSCHAAHIMENRVYPCGKCEKCRRIVGMLKAIGANPNRCGYSQRQIEYCLSKIQEKGIHQESAGVQQLHFMLHQKGILQYSKANKKLLKEHPEILKIRIDPERSPLEGIPRELRQPLLEIYLKHAEGIVMKRGRSWINYVPFKE
jgi:7-cyano-7-deazaguanine synthase in queuosine biosynthesis